MGDQNKALLAMFMLGMIVSLVTGISATPDSEKDPVNKRLLMFSVIWFIFWALPGVVKVWIVGVMG